MFTPLLFSRRARFAASCHINGWIRGLFLTALIGTSPELKAKTQWPVIPPEQIAATSSTLDPEATGEVLLLRVDRDEDSARSKNSTYLRYKIYQPDKAEGLTRYTKTYSEWDTIEARLTLPDGTTKEFGKESIKKQEGTHYRGFHGEKENLLAVPGVEPGSIVEFMITTEQPAGYFTFWANSAQFTHQLQRRDFPMRRVEINLQYPKTKAVDFRWFLINAPTAKIDRDEKTRVLSVTADNLPALHTEPHLGPFTDYGATIMFSFNSRDIEIDKSGLSRKSVDISFDPKAGPWAPVATVAYAFEAIQVDPTKRCKRFVEELCAGAPTDMEKARRIHNKVQDFYHQFTKLPKRDPRGNDKSDSPDQTLDFTKKDGPVIWGVDFYWLALSLYRAAGLDARSVLLPDRNVTRFDRNQPSPLFLPTIAIMLQIEGKPVFSYPLPNQIFSMQGVSVREVSVQRRYPLGLLPWENQGQVGLIVQKNKEEFIPIPFAPPNQNMTAKAGVLKLDDEGNLTGQCIVQITGEEAVNMKKQLFALAEEARLRKCESAIRTHLESAKIDVTKIAGLDSTDAPLVVTFDVRWPGYATRMGDRLILQPSVFRRDSKPEFPAQKRWHPIHFHTPWQELDRLAIQLPPGFEPEATPSPDTIDGGALLCKNTCTYYAAKGILGVERQFSSQIIDVPVAKYASVKEWYDQLNAADHYEVVLVKKTAQAPATDAPSATP